MAAWTLLTSSPGWTRQLYGNPAWDGTYMYVYGGATTSCFRSSNGISWTQISSTCPATTFGIESRAIYFNGYFWLLQASLYRSSDTVSWTTIGAVPGTSGSGSDMCVHNNRLYITGGGNSSYASLSNVVVSTLDGTSWTTHQSNGATSTWTARHFHSTYSLGGRLFLTGGASSTEHWYSDDNGATWTLHGSSPSWAGSNRRCIVAFGYAYALGANAQSVYYSNDGLNWTDTLASGLSVASSPGLVANSTSLFRMGGTISGSASGAVYTTAIPEGLPTANDLIIGSYGVKIRPWPKPTIIPSVRWVKNSAGNYKGSDRGASQDVYETEIKVIDAKTVIDNLHTALNTDRDFITISQFPAPIFSPEVDHTVPIDCAVMDYGEREQVSFNGSTPVYSQTFKLRALSPTLLGTTASLSTLRLQESFSADHEWEVGKSFTQTNSLAYGDRNSDAGVFVGRFSQKTSEAQAILAYLMTTARASSFTMPTFSGVTYPFGISRGSGPFTVVAKSFSIERQNLNRWLITIEFREVA